nr:dual specificity protein phosphatase family protein [Hahella ganghwensis]
MPRPSSEWLEDDVRYFAKLGITKVLSLMEVQEASELGLAKEKAVLQQYGIEFLNFPIRDRGLPKTAALSDLVDALYLEVSSGQVLAIHCRAGIGRTGILASCLLIKDQYNAQTAIDMISSARGISIPDTQEQYDFICDFEAGKLS